MRASSKTDKQLLENKNKSRENKREQEKKEFEGIGRVAFGAKALVLLVSLLFDSWVQFGDNSVNCIVNIQNVALL